MIKTRYLFGFPLVTLLVNSTEIEAILDTGFNGSLLLPLTTVKELQLPFVGATEYVLADGTFAYAEIFSAEVQWLAGKRYVLVVGLDTDFPLVGMRLIKNIRIVLEASKGIFTIEKSN